MRKSFAVLLLCALTTPFSAFALSCGDTVTTNVRLNADLHCATGTFALHVPTSGVTIDLNGHTIGGDTGIPGISLYDASDVTIVGPGKIRDFAVGIYATRSHGLRVIGVDFEDVGMGASVSHSMNNTFTANTFSRTRSLALGFYDNSTAEPRRDLYRHTIAENAFADVYAGVRLCGIETGGSSILNNSFARVHGAAIELSENSDRNTIGTNVVVDGYIGIAVGSSSLNTIRDNTIENTRLGLTLRASHGSCNRMPMKWAAQANTIENNKFSGQRIGIVFGEAASETTANANSVRGNLIEGNYIGLYFRPDATGNDGTANDYPGTIKPVIDENGANVY
jgi:parallel beta-helix repeat protein